MERNKSLDGLKYLLIIFVVIGHFIEPSRYNNQLSSCLFSFIYSFHMPLFILLSGYFYKQRDFKEEIYKCLPLLEVCLISNLGYTLFKSHKLSLIGLIDFSYTPSWYLLSLVYWRLLSSVLLLKFSIKKVLILGFVVELFSFICIFKFGGLFSIMRTLQFYPYFLIGYLLKDRLSILERNKLIIALGGVISFILIILTSSRLQHVTFFQRDSLFTLTEISQHNFIWAFLYRYIMLFLSVGISSLILLITYKNKIIQQYANYGQKTLFIYFGQTILFPVATHFFREFEQSLFVALLTVVMLTYISMKPISKVLMNPISSIIKNRSSDNERYDKSY